MHKKNVPARILADFRVADLAAAEIRLVLVLDVPVALDFVSAFVIAFVSAEHTGDEGEAKDEEQRTHNDG